MRTDEPRAGYYDRRPRDIFANQGAGLLNFNKIPADVLAAMRHPSEGAIALTIKKMTKHLMDLGMSHIVNVHKTELVALTGSDLLKLAHAIRLQHQLHNDAVEHDRAQASRFEQHRKIVRQPAPTPEKPNTASLLADLGKTLSPTTFGKISDILNPPTSSSSSSSSEGEAPKGNPLPEAENKSSSAIEHSPMVTGPDEGAPFTGTAFRRPSLSFLEDRQRPSAPPEEGSFAQRNLFATPMPPTHQDSKKVLVPGTLTTEAAWVTQVLSEERTVPSSRMFASKTPFRESSFDARHGADDLHEDGAERTTAHEERVFLEMQRTATKLEEDQFVWFSHYSRDNPAECIPESVSDRERRIYVWHLLNAIFKTQQAAFIAVRRYDIISFLRQAWRELFNEPTDADDTQFSAYRSIKILAHERFSEFVARLDELVISINEKKVHIITPEAYHLHLFGVLRKSGAWWNKLVEQAEMNGWSTKRAVAMFVRLSAQKSLSEQANQASSIDDTEYSALKKEVKSLRKQANQHVTAQAKAARASSSSSSSSSIPREKRVRGDCPKGHCWRHFKHGACPDGVNCKYEHDSANGPLGNTAPPEYYKCYHCKGPHWVSSCTTTDAIEARAKRADERVAHELAREAGRGTNSTEQRGRGKGRDTGGRGRKKGKPDKE
jgi:hypothetical protein